MVKLIVTYTNKTIEIKYFDTWKEADWYAHNGGDHVLDYKIIELLYEGEV